MYNYTSQATHHAKFDFDPTTWVVWANSQFATVSGVFLPSFLPFYRQDAAKLQTAGIKFTHRQKIRFYGPQGRLVAPIHVKLCKADRNVGPLTCAKCDLNHHRGWECGATPLTDLENF